MLKEQLKHFNIDDKMLSVRELKGKISDAKNQLLSPDEWFRQERRRTSAASRFTRSTTATKSGSRPPTRWTSTICWCKHAGTVRRSSARAGIAIGSAFEYVHGGRVSGHQRRPVRRWCKLIGRKQRNLCVVGDDDQSIYGWRGADIRNILDFQKDFPDAKVIKLEQNYRSTANILDAANQVIAHNAGRKEKALWTELPRGRTALSCIARRDEREEAAWVCDRIAQQHRRHRRIPATWPFCTASNAQSPRAGRNAGAGGHSLPHLWRPALL